MSYIKAFQNDAGILSERAQTAAWEGSFRDRLGMLTDVFGDCGTVAKGYPDPPAVAHALVCQVAEAYRNERRLINASH